MDRSENTPPQPILLADYRPPDFRLLETELIFHLEANSTRVECRLQIEKVNPGADVALVLDGESLTHRRIDIDGRVLGAVEYAIADNTLTIANVPDRFELATEVVIDPAANTALSGLYASSGNLCTQCEAEGFRRITWFLDRPDVLSRYRTTLVADPEQYPVLLANGNQVDSGDYGDGRHYVVWDDPWPKPSYLFALVAGRLEFVERNVTTGSKRPVRLRIYAEPHNVDKCEFALDSLEKAMRWDERVYGREYDLDVYNVVAVDDFNMGAMENKGLNVFNSKYVLASPSTATDTDYQNIEGVIGHEYFHNWSGNRVTCRDWFQLSLKEGFTVFRDQQFSADTTSEGVKRIQDVDVLRTHQFREDAGPMAHPVQPSQYVEINNFYTVTIYNKGAEVVRMLYQLAGAAKFRRGTDIYFARHDGEAVTIDDFIDAIAEGADLDLTRFRRWYDQAGTPKVEFRRESDDAGNLLLVFSQSCDDTPGQSNKKPFHIPVAFAAFTQDGEKQVLDFGDEESVTLADDEKSAVLHLRDREQRFVVHGVSPDSVPSVLRAFSAPVNLSTDLNDDELTRLMAYDDDPFNRWEAGQRLATECILARAAGTDTGDRWQTFSDAFGVTLAADMDDLAFKAEALSLPSESLLAESMATIDPDALHAARKTLATRLAENHYDELVELYSTLNDGLAYQPDAGSAGRRALKNVCLGYLTATADDRATALACAQIEQADNMTDEFAAFRCIATGDRTERQGVVDAFYAKWQHEPLVVDKWFAAQALRPASDVVADIQRLKDHPAFDEKNPNRSRSLYGVFASANLVGFHGADGAGYRIVGDFVRRLDAVNPQVAARLVSAFLQWRRFDHERRLNMRIELEKTLERTDLSKDVFEIVSKSLAET